MSKIVTFTEASSLAIHAVVLIAQQEESILINANYIADTTGASRNHLSKVMQKIVKQGIVSSLRGPNGGFKMKKDPSDVSLYDIYQSIEGPIELEDCPLERPICPFEKCIMGGIINKATNDMKKYLIETTIDKFI